MYQVYLLSVVTLVLASVALGYDRLDERFKISSFFSETVFKGVGFQLGLGIVTLLVGFFQLLTVAEGDVKVVGDLVPALAGMVLGGTLIVVYYKEKTTEESGTLDTLDRLLVQNAPNLAYVGLVVAALHFLLHRVLFL
jgi:hypothetical protein